MNKTKTIYLALLVMLSPMANADLIVNTGTCANTGTGTCFTSVQGLEVNGSTYDVDWYDGVYNDLLAVYPGIATFIGDQAMAVAAALALATAWGDTGTPLSALTGWGGVYIPYLISGSTVHSWVSFSSVPYLTSAGSPSQLDSENRPFAIFTAASIPEPAPVPEPGTLSLLGLGLVGMAARRRKKV